jgi:type II secretory pathway component PulF
LEETQQYKGRLIMTIISIIFGIILGWFFLPTPEWATRAMSSIVEKIPFLGKFLKK